MTNYPPPPSGQPPFGQPQPGQSQYGAPGAAYGMPAQPRPGNGWSVAALVTGLVGFCLPALGGLLAVVFGILGIKRAGTTRTGRGMSIAGLILGLLSLGVWLLFGGAIWALIQGTAVNRDLAKQFITDLSTQNTTAAGNAVDPAKIDADELKTYAATVSGGGQIQDITTFSVSANTGAGGSEAAVAGVVTYAGGKQMQFNMRQVKVGDQWKVVEFLPAAK